MSLFAINSFAYNLYNTKHSNCTMPPRPLQPQVFCFTWPNSILSPTIRHQHSTRLYQYIRQSIAQAYTIPTTAIQISKSIYGKPYIQITKPFDIKIGIFLSISHCQSHSIAILHHSPCALDLEPISPRTYLARLMHRLLHACQNALIQIQYSPQQLFSQWLQLSHHQQKITFYKLWTFSESWCKWQDNTLWQTLQAGIPFPWPSLSSLQSCQIITITPHCICHFYTPGKLILCILTTTPLPTPWHDLYPQVKYII